MIAPEGAPSPGRGFWDRDPDGGGTGSTSVSAENATIDYEVRGAGPSAVLINGMCFGLWGLFQQVPYLSRCFVAITFDAYGTFQDTRRRLYGRPLGVAGRHGGYR